jgi:hypothetical protein
METTNPNYGKILLKLWMTTEEILFLFTSKDGEKINKLLMDIRDREGIANGPMY